MGLGLQGAVLLLGACGGADVRAVGESGEEAAHLIKARKQRDRRGPEANHVLHKHPQWPTSSQMHLLMAHPTVSSLKD